MFQSENATTPTVTYIFLHDAPSVTDELATVKAYLDDGTPVAGFDGT